MYEIMPLTRRTGVTRGYNPFSLLNEIEKNFFTESPSSLGFKTDIKDTGDAYELAADLPGFDKENIHVEIEGDILTISAERNSEVDEKDEEGTYIRRERTYGSFSRGFDISNIDADKIAVKYENGVLTLDMPKKGADEPKVKRLTIA